ncbi:MAG: VOC family protein [Acidimicrobiales bacterium]|jgi:catechol 2,3-dioxygenase-like lactoylglutathione lyase family enzyme
MQGARIAMISVPVSNPDRSKDWYERVLGFDVESDQSSPGMRWVMMRPPGGETAITLTTWFETMPPGSLRGTVLAVPDIDVAVSELRSKQAIDDDAEIESAPWGRWVTVEDPDGNGWIVQQNAEGPVELGVAD